MATANFPIITSRVDLVSKWSVSQDSDGSYTYGWPRTDTESFDVDLSSITQGSRLISATFYANCNKPRGDSYVRYGNNSLNITNNKAVNGLDVTSWFTDMSGSTWRTVTFIFSHQGYNDIPSGVSTLVITSSSLVVEYEYPNSTGTLDKANVDIGSTITLTINPVNSEYTHDVVWKFGADTIPGTISNLQSSWSIPNYLSSITNSTSAAASVELTTKDASGTTVGTPQTYNFNITVPSNYVPSAGAITISIADGTACVVQNNNTANLSIANVTAGEGSSISSVVFSGWGTSVTATASGTTYTANTGVIADSGTYTVRATITDARGRTATVTKTLKVFPYFLPVITAITAKRCTAAGVLDDSGNYAQVYINYKYASVSNQNTITTGDPNNQSDPAGIWYGKVTDSLIRSTSQLRVGTTTTSNDTKTVSNSFVIIGSSDYLIDPDYEYIARIVIRDSYNGTAEATIKIPTTSYVLHFKNGGKSVAVGQAAITDNAFTVNNTWHAYLGGADVAAFHPHLEYKGVATGNLNSYTEMGTYSVESVTGISNLPCQQTGQLIVMSVCGNEKGTKTTGQIYITSTADNIYTRIHDGNNYSALWNRVFVVGSAGSANGALPIEDGGTGQSTVEGIISSLNLTKRIVAGNVINLPTYSSFIGFITSSSSLAEFTIPLGRDIYANSVEISGYCYIIGAGGKVAGADTGIDINSLGQVTASFSSGSNFVIIRIYNASGDGYPKENQDTLFEAGNNKLYSLVSAANNATYGTTNLKLTFS